MHRRPYALAAILTFIAIVWIGVAWIGINADDYQYIETMAPIAHAGDVLRPFVAHDANPNFFRPLSNATLALNFLIFHWNGGAYHITNLLLHLIACGLMYPLSREVFGLRHKPALAAVFAFGLMASHEYNLVVDTARADVFVAIFSFLTLIAFNRALVSFNRARAGDELRWRIVSYVAFALALCSKEIAVTIVAFLPVLYLRDAGSARVKLKPIVRNILPFVMIALLFYWYHAQYTVPVIDSDPLTQVWSIGSLVRNAIYAVGYLVLPLDLASATALLAGNLTMVAAVGVLLFVLCGYLIYRTHSRADYLAIAMPCYFMLVTGSIVLITFERWRLYLPSAGLVIFATLIVSRVAKERTRIQRAIVFICVALLGFYHLNRALVAQAEWRVSTRLLTKARGDMESILSRHPARPLTLALITSPTKLGSASVIQLGLGALVRRAEMDRIAPNRMDGSVGDAHVNGRSCVEVYALDRNEAYEGLRVTHIGAHQFHVAVDSGRELMLVPSGIENGGVARRDIVPRAGDTVATDISISVVRAVDKRMIQALDVILLDTMALPVLFDGRSIRALPNEAPR